ncbi:DUF167 domain-containing protein [Thalassoglobus polymorphus]|uniref:UPF0235 protein Mal48_04960 n=1 Tax=Thalassoglobus polymorphus TaxID=2527994 RepID=A0A517QHZ3_9PLAN|nr:DUF167 domain-containing protein [Thalassoglobus polymorphus]QDT31263.1 hypothetical protein Mal48_04960 [Thalassoglobus polymorphus]
MTLNIQTHENDALLLPIQALPGSRRNGIIGEHDGHLKVAVTQVPEKGKANKAIIKLLSKELQLSKSQLMIVSGETNSRKKLRITGISSEQLLERLKKFLNR